MENLQKIFEKYGYLLSNLQQKQFEDYFSFMIETNKTVNLTAITDPTEVIKKHFLDSVLPEKFFPENAKVIDVGSGAGFPALPLKIVRPELEITMLDSLNKRIIFLKNAICRLNLQKIYAIHGRAEDFAQKNREKFDVATARAVAPLVTLVEYLLPFVKVGGIAIIYKSAKLDDEIFEAKKAISVLGGKIEETKIYKIDDMQRNVLILRKMFETPQKYPRSGNKPKLQPIK